MSTDKTLARIRAVDDYDLDGDVLSFARLNNDKGCWERVFVKLDPYTASGVAYLCRRYLTVERDKIALLLSSAGGPTS